MRTLVNMISGQILRRGWVTSLVVVGLGTATWVSAALMTADEDVARDGDLRTAAASHNRGLSSDRGQALRSLGEAVEFVHARRAKLKHVADYTSVFSKTEFVDQRLISRTMDLKLREFPFSVYVRGHSKRQPAREVVFVEGKNDGKLLVHESGIRALITIHLKPDDPRVMAENRYAITEIGMAKMLDIVLAIWKREKDIAPANVDVLFSALARVGSNDCEEIQITHRQRLPGLKFHITRVAFEIQSGFPVLLEQYDWPKQAGERPPLVEQYLYSDIKTNCGLTDADFDPENSGYNF